MKFKIDFFELAFLAENCIPPRPIARTMFWQKLIDQHYQYMSENEKKMLYGWIGENDFYKKGIEENNEDCLIFESRYNPDNQYVVETFFEGKTKVYDCFKLNGRYHVNMRTSINEDSIVNVEKK
jgi:hypothetical protein